LDNARAGEINERAAKEKAMAEMIKNAGQGGSTSGGMGLGDMIKGWFGGGSGAQSPAGVVRPPVGTNNPQMPAGPQGTGPSPTSVAPGLPSTIKISPDDLKSLGIGVGSGLMQEGVNPDQDDDDDDAVLNPLNAVPMYGDGQ